MDNKIREAFEKWASREGFDFTPSGDYYRQAETRIAFLAYKAGAESMQEENKRLIEALQDVQRHQKIISNGLHERTGAWAIAEQALNGKEGEQDD